MLIWTVSMGNCSSTACEAEVLDYFQPRWWWIENPWLSRMRDYITDLPYVCVDYCMYVRKWRILCVISANFPPGVGGPFFRARRSVL